LNHSSFGQAYLSMLLQIFSKHTQIPQDQVKTLPFFYSGSYPILSEIITFLLALYQPTFNPMQNDLEKEGQWPTIHLLLCLNRAILNIQCNFRSNIQCQLENTLWYLGQYKRSRGSNLSHKRKLCAKFHYHGCVIAYRNNHPM